MNFQLRRATLTDLDALAVIENNIFPADAWSREAFAKELSSPHSLYLLAAAPGSAEILGYAGLRAPNGGDQADIQTLAVTPPARRQGIGAALLDALLAEARSRAVLKVFLEVRADNLAAQALYASRGFISIDTRVGYYQPGNIDARVLSLQLSSNKTSAHSFAAAPLVLGIETSCDETGIGIVRGTELLANVISSSMLEHARYGGVVPEIASRAHLEALAPTIHTALDKSGVDLTQLDAVAVTAGPGLAGALMVGIGAAKGLALALEIPLYAVNHLVGHIGANMLNHEPLLGSGKLELPTIALLVSGGHTALLLVRDLVSDVVLLGETLDDAAGEAFDKVARLLGLAYPGGPEIDRVALLGDPEAIRFPRGLSAPKDRERHRYNFSFSGLKTAVARYLENTPTGENTPNVPNVAASFREAVVDVLLTKALSACRDFGVPRLLLGGGVVANARLREEASLRCAEAGVDLRVPPLDLCTDNGAMIAALAAQLIEHGHPPSRLDFSADSTLPVTSIQI